MKYEIVNEDMESRKQRRYLPLDHDELASTYPEMPRRKRLDSDWVDVVAAIRKSLPFEIPTVITNILEEMCIVESVILVYLPDSFVEREPKQQKRNDCCDEWAIDSYSDMFYETDEEELLGEYSHRTLTRVPQELIGKVRFGDMIDFSQSFRGMNLYFVGFDNESVIHNPGEDGHIDVPWEITQHMSDAGYRYRWNSQGIHFFESSIMLRPNDSFVRTCLVKSSQSYPRFLPNDWKISFEHPGGTTYMQVSLPDGKRRSFNCREEFHDFIDDIFTWYRLRNEDKFLCCVGSWWRCDRDSDSSAWLHTTLYKYMCDFTEIFKPMRYPVAEDTFESVSFVYGPVSLASSVLDVLKSVNSNYKGSKKRPYVMGRFIKLPIRDPEDRWAIVKSRFFEDSRFLRVGMSKTKMVGVVASFNVSSIQKLFQSNQDLKEIFSKDDLVVLGPMCLRDMFQDCRAGDKSFLGKTWS